MCGRFVRKWGLRSARFDQSGGCASDDGADYLHWWLVEYVGGDVALDPREVSDARWWFGLANAHGKVILSHEFDEG